MAFISKKAKNSDADLFSAVKDFLSQQEDLSEKSLATLFYGAAVKEEEKEKIEQYLQQQIPFLEIVRFNIERKLYDLELVLE